MTEGTEHGRAIGFVRALRLLAWTSILVVVAIVVVAYDSLPDRLLVSRWKSADTSWLLALRVPVIDIVTLGGIELLVRSTRRAMGTAWTAPFAAILYTTFSAKTLLYPVELLTLPRTYAWMPAASASVVIVGIGAAVWQGRALLRPENRRELHLTHGEGIAAVPLVLLLVISWLPLV